MSILGIQLACRKSQGRPTVDDHIAKPKPCHPQGACPASPAARRGVSGVPECREGLSEGVASVVLLSGIGDEADEGQSLGAQGAQGHAVVGDTVEAVIVAHGAPVVEFAILQHTLYELCRIAFGIELLTVYIPKEIGREAVRQLFGVCDGFNLQSAKIRKSSEMAKFILTFPR